jgi:PAS domain-containing protein
MERLAAEPYTPLRYFCSPQHTDSALYPIISQMERTAGFVHDDTTQAKLDKLDALLAQSFTPTQDAALLAEMLSLPKDGRYPSLELAPQQRREKTLEALTAQLEALSQSKPVLMVFEDVHWVDPTSLEALGRAVDRLRTLGVLLIVTYRPEFEAPWIGRPYVTVLSLNRLGEREIAAIIDRVTGNKALLKSIRQTLSSARRLHSPPPQQPSSFPLRREPSVRIAETLDRQFAEIADNEPELLARHCTEAGLIDRIAPKAVRPHPGPAAPQEALRLVLETALDAVMVVMKSDGVVADWNDRAAGVFGWSRDEAVGRAMADLIIPERYREATPKRTSTISQNRHRKRFRDTH